MCNGKRVNHRMSRICPWPTEALPYDGLCTHSALIEAIRGDHGLTDEQLNAEFAALKERRAAAQRIISKNHAIKAQLIDIEAFRARNRRKTNVAFQRDPDKARARYNVSLVKAIANKTCYCELCNYATKNSKTAAPS